MKFTTKLLDKITRILRKKGVILRNPIKRKNYAKPGQCKFIESYDLEADFRAKIEENAKLYEENL